MFGAVISIVPSLESLKLQAPATRTSLPSASMVMVEAFTLSPPPAVIAKGPPAESERLPPQSTISAAALTTLAAPAEQLNCFALTSLIAPTVSFRAPPTSLARFFASSSSHAAPTLVEDAPTILRWYPRIVVTAWSAPTVRLSVPTQFSPWSPPTFSLRIPPMDTVSEPPIPSERSLPTFTFCDPPTVTLRLETTSATRPAPTRTSRFEPTLKAWLFPTPVDPSFSTEMISSLDALKRISSLPLASSKRTSLAPGPPRVVAVCSELRVFPAGSAYGGAFSALYKCPETNGRSGSPSSKSTTTSNSPRGRTIEPPR